MKARSFFAVSSKTVDKLVLILESGSGVVHGVPQYVSFFAVFGLFIASLDASPPQLVSRRALCQGVPFGVTLFTFNSSPLLTKQCKHLTQNRQFLSLSAETKINVFQKIRVFSENNCGICINFHDHGHENLYMSHNWLLGSGRCLATNLGT